MSTSLYSTTNTSTAQLSSYFTSLVNNIMTMERQPVTRLKTQSDNITVQKAAYTDLSAKLTALHDSTKALMKSDAFFSLTQGRKVTVTPSSGTVLTATAGSAALTGSYDVSVTQLARGQKVRSTQQAYADQALNFSGTFRLGGDETRSLAGEVTNESIIAFSLADAELVGQELGSGDYFVETQQNEGVWQFRVVDADGKAQSILRAGSDSEMTNGWQAIPTGGGAYSTGRGLEFTFAAEGYQSYYRTTESAAKVSYTAQGASIAVEVGDSLDEIAGKINQAEYGEGNEVTASVVDRQLILRTKYMGETRTIAAADVGADTVLQQLGVVDVSGDYLHYNAATDSARNAIFTVNDMTVTRSKNNELSDVITGVSITLAADAEGKTASITINEDNAAPKTAINAFITKYNDLQTYLKGKIATTKNADGTYTRGTLAGEYNLRSLNRDLYALTYNNVSNTGIYNNLMEIGLGFDDNNNLKVTDSTKLETALTKNYIDVEAMLDGVMTGVSNKLSMYTGDSGYVNRALEDSTSRIESLQSRITSMNARLSMRETSLTNQYLLVQAQLQEMSNQQSLMNTWYGSSNYSA